jgi:sugar phosphate permease
MTGIVQAGAGIGGLVIAPFVGWLTIGYGWRTASLVLGVMSAALLILAGLFLRRDPRDIGQFPDGVGTETADEVRPRKQNPKASVISLRPFVSTASFWMIAGIYASFGFFRSALTVHIAAHVQDLGFSLPDAANVLAIVSVASIIGRVGMGRVADKVGNRRTLIISFITTTLIIVWLTIAGNLWDFYLFAIVYGFGWGALAVLRYSVTAEIFGLASVGFIMGTLGFPESLASAFSSYLGGVFFDLSGSYNTLYIICIAVSFLGVLLSWRLKPSRFVTENAITTFQEEGDM